MEGMRRSAGARGSVYAMYLIRHGVFSNPPTEKGDIGPDNIFIKDAKAGQSRISLGSTPANGYH
jgi:hypothetical protein